MDKSHSQITTLPYLLEPAGAAKASQTSLKISSGKSSIQAPIVLVLSLANSSRVICGLDIAFILVFYRLKSGYSIQLIQTLKKFQYERHRAKRSLANVLDSEPSIYLDRGIGGEPVSNHKLFHYRANVDRVVDGDTIDVTLDLGFDIQMKARIRFHGINAPESRTRDAVEKEAGLASKRYVEDWTNAQENSVIIQTSLDEKGKYGRILGRILSGEGDCLNDEMVSLGHATPYDGGKR
jgi:endonuclease YncB( thermonuclease family)